MGCHVILLLLRLVDESEGEDGNGGTGYLALVIWESGWSKISVFAISLSQNISFRDKTLLLGRIGNAPTSTWFVRLISIQINLVFILRLRVLLS